MYSSPPPFQVPDETNHFYRILQIAQGHLIPDKRGNYTGGTVPRSAVSIAEGFTHKIIHNPENKLSKARFENGKQPLNPQDTIYFNFPNSSLYSPVSYIPQLLFVTPAFYFDLAPLWLMYLGRISSVLVSVLLLTFAIRALPAFHWSLFAIVMLPQFLFQMASLSADGFLNSLALLLVALAIRTAFTDKVLTGKMALQILLVTALLSFCKAGYLFLTLLFLLPVFVLSNKVHRRQWILFSGVLFVCAAVISMLWSGVVKATFSPYGNPGINPDAAIAFIKANPVQFMWMVLKNILQNTHFYAYGIVGFLGWLDVQLPFILTVIYLALLVAVVYAENRGQFEFSWRQHLLILFVAASVCLIIIVSQYLVTTAAGSLYIERSQGRYFLPVLLPLLLILRLIPFPLFSMQRIGKNLKIIVPVVAIGSSLVAFYAIINRYYF